MVSILDVYKQQLSRKFASRRLVGRDLVGKGLVDRGLAQGVNIGFWQNVFATLKLYAGKAALCLAFSAIAACGSDSANNAIDPVELETSSQSSIHSISSASRSSLSAGEAVVLSGTITYDWVGVSTQGRTRLNYDAVARRPARSIRVQLLDSLNQVISTTTTDGQGYYQFNVAMNRAVKIRAKAQLVAGNYSVTVKDNTAPLSGAEYVLDGRLVGSGTADVQTRNLHANLGWNSVINRYDSQRQSAPFAILDTLLDGVNLILDTDPEIVLPHLDVYWSVNNVASPGNVNDGDIGSSFYTVGESAIYVLGHADNDTDEFDFNVLLHEFGHYIEDKLSRSDSIGGNHARGRPLDMRVAFGEGFGNAFAGMSSGDPIYADTNGRSQQSGFNFDLESNRFAGGFYMEGSVQSILFDLFDSNNEPGDPAALGFSSILGALRDVDYLRFDGYTSMHLFRDVLINNHPSNADDIESLMQRHQISGTDAFGSGETSNAGASISLPIYHRITIGQVVEVCSDNQIPNFGMQEFNGFSVNRFLLLEIPFAGNYNIRVERTRGLSVSNPNFQLHRRGLWVAARSTNTTNVESWSGNLNTGIYSMVVQEAANIDDDFLTGGLVCFNVSLN